MKLTISKKGMISVVLSIVLIAVCMMPSFLNSKKEIINPNEKVRTINAEKVLNTSADGVISEFFELFYDYDAQVDYNEEQIFVSTYLKIDEYTPTTYYEITMSRVAMPYREGFSRPIAPGTEELEPEETVLFNIVCYDIIRGVKTESDTRYIYLYNTEDYEEYYLADGEELVSVADFFEESMVDNCVAIASSAVCFAVAVVSVLIVYTITEVFVPAFKTLFGYLWSFFSWIKRTIVSTEIVRSVVAYNVRVFERDFELAKVDEEFAAPDPGLFYLAFIFKQDVFISRETIVEEEAIAIHASSMFINIDGADYLLNTYTFEIFDAGRVAAAAAGGFIYHSYHGDSTKGVYFQHYHPKNSRGIKFPTHSFFGMPNS